MQERWCISSDCPFPDLQGRLSSSMAAWRIDHSDASKRTGRVVDFVETLLEANSDAHGPSITASSSLPSLLGNFEMKFMTQRSQDSILYIRSSAPLIRRSKLELSFSMPDSQPLEWRALSLLMNTLIPGSNSATRNSLGRTSSTPASNAAWICSTRALAVIAIMSACLLKSPFTLQLTNVSSAAHIIQYRHVHIH